MTSASPAPETRVAERTAAARWRGFRARYPFAEGDAVGPVDLSVAANERVLLLGASGSGKSTLLLSLTGLVPETIPAETTGTVELFGEDASSRPPAAWAARVGQFFQDADQTLCGMTVEDEIAFGPENLAWPEPRIRAAVGEAMRAVGLDETLRRRRTATLSGGEKQLVALAATLATGPELFVADEPTANLAPAAAARLHRLIASGGWSRGVLVVDHRLDGLIDAIDRVVVLGEGGLIVAEGPPRELFRRQRGLLAALGVWTPLASDLDAELERAGVAPRNPPLGVAEALAHLDPARASTRDLAAARPAVAAFVARHVPARTFAMAAEAPPLVTLERAAIAPFLGPVVLRDVDVSICAGEVVGLVGANGAGKSTLGLALAGLLRLKSGRREGPPGGVAFQNPEAQFSGGSVREEIDTALAGTPRDGRSTRIDEILAAWDLAALAERHPFELSQGQKRRLALASLSGGAYPLVVLDEPLAGLDASGAAMVAAAIDRLRAAGRAVAIITHDMDFALATCPRAIVLGEGGVLADGPTAALLADPALVARAGLAEPQVAPALRWLGATAPC
jgi:energy-coupling factor transport system ATP-binding protein